ncbi:MAG: protein kinase [Mariniblastus sp.]
MSNCPSTQDLSAFLEDRLSDQDAIEQIVLHLENCDACQSQMDALCPDISDDSPANDNTFREQETNDESVEKLITELTRTPPQIESRSLTGSKLGLYEIKEPIGRGTSGIVYRAEDTRLQRMVAVKALKTDFTNSDRARTRLEREARAAASLKHQNVVGVHDIQIDPIGISYLVLELVEGGTLKQLIRGNGSIESKQACDLAMQILRGLESAHSKGLVHRDLKSSNVLLKPTANRSAIAKLTDFGLVRDLDSDSNLTRENVVAGTPAYMSPEQVLAPHDVDHRADIYSLGIVLYEMLTGELPFRGVDRMVLQQVVHDDAKPPCRINDSIDRDLETICVKSISKSPDARYGSAREMHDDLERWLQGKPIHARRIGFFGKAWNWSRRNRAVASLLGLTIGLLSLIAIGSTINAISIRQASLERERYAVAARRQRDQSLETIRKLVFEVNELLEPGMEGDLDETQIRLLKVALEGIERIDQTGKEAGLVDVSSIAAKNRLGDVYFRLGEIDSANKYFKSALSISDALPDSLVESDNQTVTEERLRAYEGLVSFAQDRELEQEASLLREKAEEEAAKLSSIVGFDVAPEYYSNEVYRLEEDELAELIESFQQLTEAAPNSRESIKSATAITHSLGWHFEELNEPKECKRQFTRLLEWLDSVDLKNTKSKLLPTLQTAKHHAYYGLSEVANMEADTGEYVELLRKSIDILPKSPRGDGFADSVFDDASQALGELTLECETLEPDQWMVQYFKQDAWLASENSKDFPANRRLEFANLEAQARLTRYLFLTGSEDEAKIQWQSISKTLKVQRLRNLNFSTEGLSRELDLLATLGFADE